MMRSGKKKMKEMRKEIKMLSQMIPKSRRSLVDFKERRNRRGRVKARKSQLEWQRGKIVQGGSSLSKGRR